MPRRTPRVQRDQPVLARDFNELALAVDAALALAAASRATRPAAVMLGRVVLVNGADTAPPPGLVETFTYTVRVYSGDQGSTRPGFTDLVGVAPEWRMWPDGTTVTPAAVGSLCLLGFVHGPEHGGEDTRGLVLLYAHEVPVVGDCAPEPEP